MLLGGQIVHINEGEGKLTLTVQNTMFYPTPPPALSQLIDPIYFLFLFSLHHMDRSSSFIDPTTSTKNY